MELNTIGKKIKRSIIAYLKEIGQHRKIEETILIDSTAKAYELYLKYLEKAEYEMEFADDDCVLGLKLHALSGKQYVMYTTNLKTLGISAIQRAKLEIIEKEEVKPDSIFEKIANIKIEG